MTSIVYNAPPVIGEFMRSDAFVRGLMGPFGSGKSVACVVEMLRRCLEQKKGKDGIRRSRWAVIRNTYRELNDTTRNTFEDWMPGGKDPANWTAGSFTFTLKLNDVEAEFLFRALDRPDDVKKLLSLEITGAWINEAREVPFQVVKMIGGRIGRYPAMKDGGSAWDGLIMDTNPPDDDSWWYKQFEEVKPGNWALFKQPGGRDPKAENIGHFEEKGVCVGHYPWEKGPEWAKRIAETNAGVVTMPGSALTFHRHLKRGYYENLAETNKSDPLWVKVHVDAQYGPVQKGKPIYPEFRDDVHVVPREKLPIFDRQPIILGQDFGLTPAAVIGQRDPADGQLQIVDELVADDLGAERFFESLAAYLKRAYPGRPISGTGDPAGEQRAQTDERTPYDIAHAQGVPLVPAHTNDFTIRREAVAHALTRLTLKGRPRLVISDKCKTLRKAMNGGYCFRRVSAPGEERFRDVPDKNSFSHVAEALQYLALGEGEDTRVLESVDVTQRAKKFKVKTAGVARRRMG